MAKTSSAAALTPVDIVAARNDRPRPVIPGSDYVTSLDELVLDARAAEKRIVDLHLTQKQTAKALLLENLNQALRIEAAVARGQSVAAFARKAQIEERRAQRLYTLAARCGKIKEEVRDGEVQHGDDYVCPSWKQFLRPATTPIVNDPYQQLKAAQNRIAELEAKNKLADTARQELEEKLQELNGRAQYGLYGHGSPEREVLQWLFDHFDREFHLTLDVAATPENAKCPRFYTKVVNGLVQIWFGNVWLNPPYNGLEPWCAKAWEYAQTGEGVVVALLPIWPSAPWFQKYVIHGHIRLLTTRFSAVGTKTRGPFDFMVVVWTATSQFKDGCLRVTMEDVPDPKKAAKAASAAAKTR